MKQIKQALNKAGDVRWRPSMRKWKCFEGRPASSMSGCCDVNVSLLIHRPTVDVRRCCIIVVKSYQSTISVFKRRNSGEESTMRPEVAYCLFLATVIALARRMDATCPGGNCNTTLSVQQMKKGISSPCYPSSYPNSLSCKWDFLAPNSSYYTQIVVTSFNVEAWYDYVKFDGTENFIIFFNATTNQVIITGYPSGSVSAALITDASRSSSGFNASFVGVSENSLLDQYSGYRADSLVQVLDSPMYLSSSQNSTRDHLDVMFMNIPNTTESPIGVWAEYAGLISNSTGVSSYNNTATGFMANWTEIDGVETYSVAVFNSSGEKLKEANNLKVTQHYVDGLPSGSVFNVSVTVFNKIGNSASFYGPATTVVAPPTNLNASQITQTSFSLHWDPVNGAKLYSINVTAINVTGPNLSAVSPPLQINNLVAGEEYNVSIHAEFDIGNSEKISQKFVTVPGNVTKLSYQNVTTTSVMLRWVTQRGASRYLIEVTEDNTKNNYTISDSIKIGGLEPGNSYTIAVVAENRAGKSYPIPITVETDLIPQSASVWAENITPNGFTVHWTTITGAARFNLTLIDGSGNETHIPITSANVNKHSVPNLPSGTRYELKLFVFNAAGKVWTMNSLRSYTTNFTEVTNVTVRSVGQTHFTIAWPRVLGATSYEVSVTGNGTTFSENRSDADSSYAVSFDGLHYGITYNVSIYAVFPTGNGPTTFRDALTKPGNVSEIKCAASTTKLNLTWPKSRGADSYVLEIKTHNAKDTKNLKKSNYIADVKPGAKYTISVKAKNKAGTGGEVQETCTTDLDPPKNFEIVGVTKNQFVLQWDGSLGAGFYMYNCTGESKSGNVTARSSNTKMTETVEGLKDDTQYSCRLRAGTADRKSGEVMSKAKTAQSFCAQSPCLNKGTCNEASERCVCTIAYTGKTCEQVINWCERKTCGDHATCTNDVEKLQAVCSCEEGFSGNPEIRCEAQCKPQAVPHGDNQTLHFGLTWAEATAFSIEKCATGGQNRSLASAVCRSQTGIDGKINYTFQNIVPVPCNLKIVNVTIQVDKNTPNVTTTALEEQSAQLQVLTSGDKVGEDDVKNVARYMEDVATIAEAKKATVTKSILVGMVTTADNLIESNSISLEQTAPGPATQSPGATEKPPETPEEREKEIKQKILKSLTSLAEQVQIPNDTNAIVIETPNIVVKVVNEDDERTEQASDIPFEPAIAASKTASGNVSDFIKPIKITIPGSAIDKVKDDVAKREASRMGEVKKLRISFFLHKDASLFPSSSSKPPEMIIAASLGEGVMVDNLAEDVKIRYNDLKTEAGATTSERFKKTFVIHECKYWDFNITDWSSEGCCLDPKNLTLCRCNHLTNFATLVSDKILPGDVALEQMSKVGLILSMIGLTLTIAIHCLKEDVRKRRPTQLLMHICGNLFFSYLVFLVGVNQNETRMVCVVITAILQFLFLASWCWMSVYAYDMYRSFVLVFNTSKSRYLTKCTIFAYGVPLLVTLLNAAISTGYIDGQKKPLGICEDEGGYSHLYDILPVESSYIASNMCWLTGYSLYFGFLLPIGLMLVFNLFVYIMVLKTLSKRNKTVTSSAKKTGMMDNFLISITLSASTGLTWVFAYLMLLSDNENYLTITSWIFAVLNVIQGAVIFLATCVRHENMRKIWLSPLTRSLSRVGTRITMLSPRRSEFDFKPTSGTGSSVFMSTTESASTKNTAVKSVSAKELVSESAI